MNAIRAIDVNTWSCDQSINLDVDEVNIKNPIISADKMCTTNIQRSDRNFNFRCYI